MTHILFNMHCQSICIQILKNILEFRMHSIYINVQVNVSFVVRRSVECMFKMQISSSFTILFMLVSNILCTGMYYMFYSNI